MKMKNFNGLTNSILSFCLATLFLAGCNNDSETKKSEDSTMGTSTNAGDTTMDTIAMSTDTAMVQSAMVNISPTYADTAVSGTAIFTTANGEVTMKLDLTIPSKAGKTVAVHLHEHGDCSDNGKSSHGHWNPTKEEHGKWGKAPYHRGDIGNVKLDNKGKGSLTITTDFWTLGSTSDKNLLGKALIVHGGMDDYQTQPTGDAGSRIGCGVIQ
ncbi:MAG: superoxide dismutase family protein [Chitinophagaceae bacterium]